MGTDAQNPNLKRYIASVTGSACSAYTGSVSASPYGGGGASEMRRSWRLSCVGDDDDVCPKKSSMGSVVSVGERVARVCTGEGLGRATELPSEVWASRWMVEDI